jgi:hypothetical protein
MASTKSRFVVGSIILSAVFGIAGTTWALAGVSDADLNSAKGRLADLAVAELGRGYACLLVPGENSGKPRELVLVVIGERAAARSPALIRRAGAETVTTVLRTRPGIAAPTMARIQRAIQINAPRQYVEVGRASRDRERTCPPIAIYVVEGAPASTEQWARDQVSRYGTRRVRAVLHVPPGTVFADGLNLGRSRPQPGRD